jgi:hypothetical protein
VWQVYITKQKYTCQGVGINYYTAIIPDVSAQIPWCRFEVLWPQKHMWSREEITKSNKFTIQSLLTIQQSTGHTQFYNTQHESNTNNNTTRNIFEVFWKALGKILGTQVDYFWNHKGRPTKRGDTINNIFVTLLVTFGNTLVPSRDRTKTACEDYITFCNTLIPLCNIWWHWVAFWWYFGNIFHAIDTNL